MSTPRPESRLSELESQMSLQGARIRELSDDTAESLRDLKQDIKRLSESVEASHKQIANFFMQLNKNIEMIKAIMAIKEDLAALKTNQDECFNKLE